MASSVTSVCPVTTVVDKLKSTNNGPDLFLTNRNRSNMIENKLSYQLAVKAALLDKKCLPYTPTEPPASLSEEIVECDPLYVCKQCKDCFRFFNSFEEHNKRRSWILGYLCRMCFTIVCTHVNKSSPPMTCSLCKERERKRRLYLRRRGLPKYQKGGVTRVFYNQCQFWEHARTHNLNTVDISNVMLMPISANMCESDWSSEVELICEALMEFSLLTRVHIMEWLKKHDLEDNWWKLINGKSHNNVLNKLVYGYRGRQVFKILEKSTVNEFIDRIKNNVTNSSFANQIMDKNVPENEDNPCTLTDIAFVDCGPTSQYFEPELSVNYIPRKQVTVVTKSAHNNIKGLTDVIKINNKKKVVTSKDLHLSEVCMTGKNFTTVKTGKNPNKNIVNKQLKDCMQQCSTAEEVVRKIAENNINKPIVETDINKMLTCCEVQPVKIPVSCEKILPKILPKSNLNHLVQGQTPNSSSKIILKILPKIKSNYLEQDQTSNNNSKILSVQSSQNTANKIVLPNTNLDQNLQTSITNNNFEIVSIKNSQNVDTSIIDQLPFQFIPNKKLLSIEQDSNNVITFDKNKVNIEKRLITSMLDISNDTDTNLSSEKICNSTGNKTQEKILIKNGKRYLIKKNIIKDTANSSNLSVVSSMTKATEQLTFEQNTSTSLQLFTKSSKAENTGIEVAPFYNDISLSDYYYFNNLFLTPSPSLSESSSKSGSIPNKYARKHMIKQLKIGPPWLITVQTSTGTQKKYLFETISLTEMENGDVYMDVKIIDRLSKEGFRDTCEVIPKYREQMIDEFNELDSFELKKRINHLQLVSEEMKIVLDFLSSNVLWEKSRSINTLQHILEKCLKKCENQDVQTEKENDDVILDEWELEISKTSPQKCSICNKLMKPKSYIPGFSKLPKDDNIYCSCYKLVCHKCLSYQDNQSRFTAHQNYHKKNCESYVCPNCHSKFNSVRSLEVHTWTVCFHTLKKFLFSCKICEIDGFRDMESITRHIVIMHCITKFACEECGKVLSSYSEYVSHITEKHPSVPDRKPIRLVKCKLGDAIVRFENFMWYAAIHPAVRKLIWLKCPFCSLITVENKYSTAILSHHLQNKHLHQLSEILGKEVMVDILGSKYSEIESAVSENIVNTTVKQVIPRIVSARTISSETFESGTEDDISRWQYTESHIAWSSRLKINPLSTKGNDAEQKISSLPKINVKSINDLKSSKPKESVMKTSTETKEKSNLQDEIIINEQGDPLTGQDAKEMELNDSKSDNQEETKESDKPNNESIVSTDVHNVRVNSLTESCKRILDSQFTSKTSTDNRIKVVDIKKLCKPNIEPFVTTEPNNTWMEDDNMSYMTYIPQPPTLVEIPKHISESMEVDSSENVARTKIFLRKTDDKTKKYIDIHGTTDTQEETVDYLCHLCGEQITSTSVMEIHFREKHSHECRLAVLTPRLKRLSSDFINGGYKQFINNKKRKTDSTFLVSKRKRRWTPKKHTETKDANMPVGLCVEQETAEDGEGNFKCKKCDKRCTDMSDLREHIAANHRLKDRYLICLECGENFVVAPSLQMHLKAFHGIEDPINYMNQNPSYAPDVDSDSQTQGKTTVANQCHVCMAVFEDKVAVDKHLRVHGMAFLNRRRIEARNALTTPEKKANLEEATIAKDSSPKEKIIIKQDKPIEIILEKLNVAKNDKHV